MTRVNLAKPLRDHPAKWSKDILEAIAAEAAAEAIRRPGPLRAYDPCCGVDLARLRAVLPEAWTLEGSDLEAPWAAASGGIVADATRLEHLEDGSIDVWVTSVDYGNRMADTYTGYQDRCTACAGRGCALGAECAALHLIPMSIHQPPHVPCPTCDGTTLAPSRRITYRISRGAPLAPGNTAVLQWGPEYRRLNKLKLLEAGRVLGSDGLLILNVSNHIRQHEVQSVVEWYLGTLCRIGFRVHLVRPVGTPRMRFGQNHAARVDHEHLLIFRRP